jgi:hypothetical protein
MARRSTRGQSTSLSTVLVLALVIVLVLTTYVWGNSLLESQQARTNANYMQSKLLEAKRNVIAVTHEGPGATRTMSVNLGEGSLKVLDGEHCQVGWNELAEGSENGIAYEMFTNSRIIATDTPTWINLDQLESSTDCTANYTEHQSGVLVAKSALDATGSYRTTYMAWFRQLTDGTNNYLINITAGATKEASGGTYELIIANNGVRLAGGTYYTDVEIAIK